MKGFRGVGCDDLTARAERLSSSPFLLSRIITNTFSSFSPPNNQNRKEQRKSKSGTPSFTRRMTSKAAQVASQVASEEPNEVAQEHHTGDRVDRLSWSLQGEEVRVLEAIRFGLLLVCGPHGINGVPVKPMNQRYAIATSTKVDVSKVDCKAFDDKYFKKPAKDRSAKSEDGFFAAPTARKELPVECTSRRTKLWTPGWRRHRRQKLHLKEYMSSLFSLKSGDKPHEMIF